MACNFPTWQCALFADVRVAVVMRFTHRFDHHVQGLELREGSEERAAEEASAAARANQRHTTATITRVAARTAPHACTRTPPYPCM